MHSAFSHVIVTALTLLLLLIVSVDDGQFVHAWGCEGHSLVVSIAQRWLRANTKGRHNSVKHFFLEVFNRAISYDGHPFPKLTEMNGKGNPSKRPLPVKRRTFSTISCLPDDVRSHPDFTRFTNWHWGEVNCFPLQNGSCPIRSASAGDLSLKSENENDKPKEGEYFGGSGLVAQNAERNVGGGGGAVGNGIHNKLGRLIDVLTEASQSGRLGHGTVESSLLFTYLLHLVADAHQPLHVCSAYGKEFTSFYHSSSSSADRSQNTSITDDDDEDEDLSIGETSAQEAAENQARAASRSDRGGNFWCISESPCKRRRRRKKSNSSNKKVSGGIDNELESISCCKENLHRFYDRIAGFSQQEELKRIIGHDSSRGATGTCSFAVNSAETCDDLGYQDSPAECCLDNIAADLIHEAVETGDDMYLRQLKELHTDVDSWTLDTDLCRSVYTDKVRGAITIDDELVEGWVDGNPLKPGKPLSRNYQKWAKEMLKRRLVLAGYRLGFVLKQLFQERMKAAEVRDLGKLGADGTIKDL